MATLNFKDDQLFGLFRKHCEEQGLGVGETIENIIFDFLFKKGESEKFNEYYIKKTDLETQAVNLIDLSMPEHIKVFAIECADVILHIPLWQHLMGIYRLAYDQQQFTGAMIDPSWRDNTVEYEKKSKCPACKQTFEPRWLGQIYCSNQCSADALQGRGMKH